ncbi:hypothetical protein TNCV_5140641 [Trichonephila clavipes]|nr:hypothetical protein TNCV_5140641 [Trichonephila clavipes]
MEENSKPFQMQKDGTLIIKVKHEDISTKPEKLHAFSCKVTTCHFAVRSLMSVALHELNQLWESIVLPVWLGSTRTRPPPGVSLPGQHFALVFRTSSFHHFTETVQGSDKITYFHQGNDFDERLF